LVLRLLYICKSAFTDWLGTGWSLIFGSLVGLIRLWRYFFLNLLIFFCPFFSFVAANWRTFSPIGDNSFCPIFFVAIRRTFSPFGDCPPLFFQFFSFLASVLGFVFSVYRFFGTSWCFGFGFCFSRFLGTGWGFFCFVF